MTRLKWAAAALTFACVALLPRTAHAQSAIAGTVKDATGAVMPGVTVEAASPVLIEKSKSVVTDAEGNYKIVDLRPGTYSVTFSLEGFSTVRREGFELPSEFTATLNAELKIGALQEALTVTGSSPVVDVQNNQKTSVISRDVLDAVPSAKTIQSLGQLIVGVQLTSPDVGGSRAMQQAYFVVHGVGAAGATVTVDGLPSNGLMGDGAVQAYHNEAMAQEIVFLTAGGNAETLVGGVTMNFVPKDGGNRFAGAFKYAKSPSDWQGNNLTPSLQSQCPNLTGANCVGAVDKISDFYEVNIEEGGPIVKDKLWFFGAFRNAHYDKPIANTFVLPAGVSAPVAFKQCQTGAISCDQGISDEKMKNPVVRVTWQMSEKNKFAAYMDRAMRLRGHAMTANTDPDTASVVWHTPTFATGSAKWTSTVSSRVLFETGFSFNRERYDNVYQPGINQPYGSAAWYAGIRKSDNSTGFLWNASSAQLGNYPDKYNYMAALSYITGSHSVKVGFLNSYGPYPRWNTANGDLYAVFQNGVAQSVTVLNTPLQTGEYLDDNLGIYAQDSWHYNKFTFNYGVRWDYVRQHVMGEPAQTGRFENAPAYGDIYLPTWKDWSPRTSVVYDLFGNGKTALRLGFNKYMTGVTSGFAQLYNPTALTTQSLAWTDLNNDGIPQGERGCAYKTPGCEIDFSTLPANFGVRSLAAYSSNLSRPYQLTYNVGVQHELFRGTSVTAEWFHIDFKNLIERNNIARTTADYTPVTVYSPIDGSPFTYYNVSAAKSAAVTYLDSNDPNLQRWYNSIELNVTSRLPGGARLAGGTSTERLLTNSCSGAGNDPNLLQFCDGTKNNVPWITNLKLFGTYPLPWYGISVSAGIQSLPTQLGTSPLQYGVFTAGTGFTQPNGIGTFMLVQRNQTYTAATCKSAGCAPGQVIVPGLTAATASIPIVAPLTEFAPRYNQVDLGASKTLRFNNWSFMPRLDLFNAFNSDGYTTVTTLQYGAATYMQPSTILQGRLVRIGVDVKW
ncbi:MAG TPA: carboxypeptidase regulatory-like domain-containing protein [Vicinamibacterales bacterium]|nr:carboxypeptidase regulatory-like domain-containing protein [Vicinamibacterales bacterium]